MVRFIAAPIIKRNGTVSLYQIARQMRRSRDLLQAAKDGLRGAQKVSRETSLKSLRATIGDTTASACL